MRKLFDARRIPGRLILLLCFLIGAAGARGQVDTETFLAGTDQELNVYYVRGDEPGPTLLIFGGVHGEEAGGFLAADRYVDCSLRKGTLIVVPRLNLRAILTRKRNGYSGDLNRKFDGSPAGRDSELVRVAQSLVEKADCVLNLHQGTGFYSPTWVDSRRNPQRWGQSNIIDAPVFDLAGGQRLELERFAQAVVRRANGAIKDQRYYFHVNNTDTGSVNSPHKEQRKSLTYYALTRGRRMALGLEATKDCTLDRAVTFLSVAVNATIRELGIVPVRLPVEDADTVRREIADRARLSWIGLLVNGREEKLLPGQSLAVRSGDRVAISALGTDCPRGWYAYFGDKKTLGSRREIELITGGASLVVCKDGVLKSVNAVRLAPVTVDGLTVELDGEKRSYRNRETISLPRTGSLRILAVTPEDATGRARVDVKGFVGNRKRNDGNDIGYPITAAYLIPRFAVDAGKTLYRIEIRTGRVLVGELFLRIEETRDS